MVLKRSLVLFLSYAGDMSAQMRKKATKYGVQFRSSPNCERQADGL